MGAFDDLNAAAADFNESVMGETFTYTPTTGSAVSGLVGVFNQAQEQFSFEDFSNRRTVDLVCVSSKTQWGATVPAIRGKVTYGGIDYVAESVDGTASAGEPCYELGLKRLS
jgi:hypothetical protein